MLGKSWRMVGNEQVIALNVWSGTPRYSKSDLNMILHRIDRESKAFAEMDFSHSDMIQTDLALMSTSWRCHFRLRVSNINTGLEIMGMM